jgi:hypothetical protein
VLDLCFLILLQVADFLSLLPYRYRAMLGRLLVPVLTVLDLDSWRARWPDQLGSTEFFVSRSLYRISVARSSYNAHVRGVGFTIHSIIKSTAQKIWKRNSWKVLQVWLSLMLGSTTSHSTSESHCDLRLDFPIYAIRQCFPWIDTELRRRVRCLDHSSVGLQFIMPNSHFERSEIFGRVIFPDALRRHPPFVP